MVTLCGVLAWRIPWTEGPGGLQSMGHEGTQTHRRGDRVLRGGTRTHTHTCSLPPWRTAAWWGAGLALGCPLGGLPSITGSPASWPPCTSGAQQVSPASCQCFLSPLSHRRWGPFLWKPQESSLASTSWKNMMPEGAVLGAGRGGRCADARPVRLAFEPGLALHHPHLP